MRNFLDLLRTRAHSSPRAAETEGSEDAGPEVRLAVYDSPLAMPRVVPLRGREFHEFVGELAARTYNSSHERGGRIPYVVIREIIENLIHAYFEGAVISVLNDGNTIRVSDQGPGILDKEKALLPGFTTATPELRAFIKGVGSGLPVAREQLSFLGGGLSIDTNLAHGTVVTLSLTPVTSPTALPQSTYERLPPTDLTPRQKKALLVIAELGSAGPSALARELAVSHSTAYRDLQRLEEQQLVRGKGRGKRTLTEDGIAVLDRVFTP